MPRHLNLKSARSELANAKSRHVELLGKTRSHCIDANPGKDGFLYLMAIPLIYAAWEGYFRIVCAVCLKRKYITGQKAKKYPTNFSGLWLQKEGFIQSYLQKLVNSMQLGKPHRPSAGQYGALCSLSIDLSTWLEAPMGLAPSFGDLVMTFSNVNREVVKLNADAIDINIASINFGRLDELLGRRNEIAHGGLLSFPSDVDVDELLVYTDGLINSFDSAVAGWLPQS